MTDRTVSSETGRHHDRGDIFEYKGWSGGYIVIGDGYIVIGSGRNSHGEVQYLLEELGSDSVPAGYVYAVSQDELDENYVRLVGPRGNCSCTTQGDAYFEGDNHAPAAITVSLLEEVEYLRRRVVFLEMENVDLKDQEDPFCCETCQAAGRVLRGV